MKTKSILAPLAACAALSAVAQTSPPPPRYQAPPAQRPAQAGQPAQRPAPPGQAQRTQQAPGLSAFGWFAELANACWRGERPNNRADVQCYTSQYNRFMRGTIKFYEGGNVVAEGDSVFAWDPNAQVIVYSQWGSSGAFGLGEIAVENGDLVFRTRLPDGSEAPTRSVWRRVDQDSFQVVRQRRDEQGGAWADDISVTYKRVAS